MYSDTPVCGIILETLFPSELSFTSTQMTNSLNMHDVLLSGERVSIMLDGIGFVR